MRSASPGASARLALLTTRPIAPAECRSGTPRTYTQDTIDRRVAAAQIGGTALSRQAAGSHFVTGAGTVGRRSGGGLLGRLMGVVVDCGAPGLPGPGSCPRPRVTGQGIGADGAGLVLRKDHDRG